MGAAAAAFVLLAFIMGVESWYRRYVRRHR